jgi:hypothetical protein
MKKLWSKPKLIVISRVNSQEYVLGPCKDLGSSVGPDIIGCMVPGAAPCQLVGNS